jgi:uncharacterized protein YggU (UPF0235/DUF167 family)
VGGSHGANGTLVVAVTAHAHDGRANAALVQALANALGVRRGDLSIVRGAKSRNKVIEISTSPADIDDRLRRLRKRAE